MGAEELGGALDVNATLTCLDLDRNPGIDAAVVAEVAEDAAPEVELTDDYVTEDAIARAWNKGKALGKYA